MKEIIIKIGESTLTFNHDISGMSKCIDILKMYISEIEKNSSSDLIKYHSLKRRRDEFENLIVDYEDQIEKIISRDVYLVKEESGVMEVS